MNLIQTLKALLVIAPKNDVRYYLNSVEVIRNGDTVVFNATNGILLLQVKTTDLECLDIQDSVKFTMCRHSLNVMIKSFNVKSKPILRLDDNFNCTLGDLPITLIDGNYPNVERVIYKSSERDNEIALDFKNLEQISKACAMVCSNKFKTGKMTLRGASESIIFSGEYSDYSYTGLIMPCRL